MPRPSRKAVSVVLALAALQAASCGAIIHPERVGRPHSGRIDPSIVLLDGLGLLLFFIPGVIAFVVDFATGAIYLPPEYGQADGAKGWTVVRVPKDELTPERIEEVVSRRAGRSVDIDADDVRIERLRTIDDPAATAARDAR